VAIGQGALTVTPIQVAQAIGGLAMGGVWYQPHLLPYGEMREMRPGFEPSEPKRAHIDPRHLDMILQGLWGVVNDGGTGSRAMIPGVEVCGKTGSAQRVSRKFAQNNDDPRLLDDAWFVGFAPCREPEIVVTALFENGIHGSYAAPIARDVIKAYYDKKARIEWTRRQHDEAPGRPEPPPVQSPSLASAEEETAAR
jgi:penicillin-binding protein 2